MIILDSRVASWAMMSSPWPTIILCLSYAYFCKSLAPRLMKNRKPFDLRKTLVVYNMFQTVFSAWIFYEVREKQFLDNFWNLIIMRLFFIQVFAKRLAPRLQLSMSTC
jgi:GNS1/SUR4 family